ncbi:hypothetical protein [Gemella cuniculi]|uniref:hypothetical protein n=1 Tax=Gemella cuniculi TaxID=150240 RepID=UPI0004025DAD|nr:hypothetical protein [Gemella cuniculi]
MENAKKTFILASLVMTLGLESYIYTQPTNNQIAGNQITEQTSVNVESISQTRNKHENTKK